MDDGKIFKVDTVPPPPGESDAYNAPTRVGAINAEEWEVLMAAHESRSQASPASQRARGEPVPASERAERARPEPAPRADAIPPPAPLPSFGIPRVGDDDDDDDVDLSWPELGAAALSAVEQAQRASLASTPPPPRPSAFPEWVAGTNVQEKAAFEAERRRRIRTWMSVGVALALVLGALVVAVLRH